MNEEDERPVAYALLSKSELVRFGPSLKRVFSIPDDDKFQDLLAKLDGIAAAEHDL